MLNAAENPRVPLFLRLVTIIECLVVFSTAAVLFFVPDLGKEIWAWAIPPYNSRFVGAIYFAALVPLVVLAATGRWAPGRMVLWMIFSFTFSIMLAMLIHRDYFEWSRPATYAFWFLYISLPINSIVHMIWLRHLPMPDGHTPALIWRGLIYIAILGLGLYGLGLLLVPDFMTSRWPWDVDDFHGRIYAATYVTPAVGAALIQKKGARSEFMLLGLTLLTLGVLSIAGVIITSATVPPARQVDYASLGAWAFIGGNVIIAAMGVGFMVLNWLIEEQTMPANDTQSGGFKRAAHLRPPAVTPPPSPNKLSGSSSETLKIQRPGGLKAAAATMTVATGARYRLELNDGTQIALVGQTEYFVGRADPAGGFDPATDLALYGGEAQGVSRQHARIFVKGVVPYIEDLDSHNGTFVNEKRLQPREPAVLKNNDRLKFGAMAVRFYIQT